MTKEISIRVEPSKENDEKLIQEKISFELKKEEIDAVDFEFVRIKKSVDARRKNVMLFLRYKIYIGESPEDQKKIPEWKNASGKKVVAIVGSGPAGLFGALKLLEHGIKSIIIERGPMTDERKRDIAAISAKNILSPNSNYCFGEGGAGTFSDGKLYTRSKKRGDISSVLKIFHHFGADEKILTDAHPHIGTDRLPSIINSMRDFLISRGCEFHFDTQFTGFEFFEGGAKKRISSIKIQNVKTGKKSQIGCDAVLLAAGHSADDIYIMLAKTAPESLEAKTFAVGARVEHPRTLIDSIQHHGEKNLGAAEYSLTSQQDERGVYTFCMCPGGFIVPSSTSPDSIVVNGMSAAGRNSAWSNSAVVVETRPEDIPQEFKLKSREEFGTEVLAGLLWRNFIERKTFEHGQGQKAPAQKLDDFLNGKKSDSLPKTSYAPGVISSRIDEWMPEQISARLKKAFREFNSKIKGFICPDALLVASETRTSAPARILRDKESGASVAIENLFPAGEGSGYSGGIVSSAMDGENQCEKIAGRI